MKNFIFIFPVLFAGLFSNAQNIDSLRLQYQQKTLRIGGVITRDGYMIDKPTLQNLLTVSPEAMESYYKYRKSRNTSMIFRFAGLASSLAGIFIIRDNRTAGYAAAFGGSLVSVVGNIFGRKANTHMQDAIWYYNRDVLYPKR
jgi:hypothetical protein